VKKLFAILAECVFSQQYDRTGRENTRELADFNAIAAGRGARIVVL